MPAEGTCAVSDHFSGPRALAGPQCDICDMYAFPSPERPGSLVMVMNVVPRATESSSFSDAIIYRFRLRRAAVAALGRGASENGPNDPGTTRFTGTVELNADDIMFDCVFDAREGSEPQRGRCVTPS